MSDGAEVWHAVEDVAQVLPEAYGVKPGDEVVRLSDAVKGFVLQRTTTDVLLRLADGTEGCHGLEDVARTDKPSCTSASVESVQTAVQEAFAPMARTHKPSCTSASVESVQTAVQEAFAPMARTHKPSRTSARVES